MADPARLLGRLLPATASEADSTGADRGARQLGLLIRAISLAAAPIGSVEALAGAAFGEPRAILLGGVSVAYAAWLLLVTRRPADVAHETTITQIASVTL